MNDRQMLYLVYGALLALGDKVPNDLANLVADYLLFEGPEEKV